LATIEMGLTFAVSSLSDTSLSAEAVLVNPLRILDVMKVTETCVRLMAISYRILKTVRYRFP